MSKYKPVVKNSYYYEATWDGNKISPANWGWMIAEVNPIIRALSGRDEI